MNEAAAEQIAALEKQLALLKAAPPAPPVVKRNLVKLDIGCGPNKRDGFLGMDQYPFEKDGKKVVDILHDVRVVPWPVESSAVEEVHCSHFLEHLTGEERCAFFNELYRVLIPGGKATIIVPHAFSARAYGDPTHQWPPIGGFTWPYLNRGWREANAPHADKRWWAKGYDCDFDFQYGFNLRADLATRNPEYVQMALATQIEAGQDLVATLTRR